jgi:hypothetical protein
MMMSALDTRRLPAASRRQPSLAASRHVRFGHHAQQCVMRRRQMLAPHGPIASPHQHEIPASVTTSQV